MSPHRKPAPKTEEQPEDQKAFFLILRALEPLRVDERIRILKSVSAFFGWYVAAMSDAEEARLDAYVRFCRSVHDAIAAKSKHGPESPEYKVATSVVNQRRNEFVMAVADLAAAAGKVVP